MEDYTRFIRTSGHLLVQCPQLDIIQLGLMQPKSSYIYKDALQCAKNNQPQVYFEWLISFISIFNKTIVYFSVTPLPCRPKSAVPLATVESSVKINSCAAPSLIMVT